jgi:hypothetical protein
MYRIRLIIIVAFIALYACNNADNDQVVIPEGDIVQVQDGDIFLSLGI